MGDARGCWTGEMGHGNKWAVVMVNHWSPAANAGRPQSWQKVSTVYKVDWGWKIAATSSCFFPLSHHQQHHNHGHCHYYHKSDRLFSMETSAFSIRFGLIFPKDLKGIWQHPWMTNSQVCTVEDQSNQSNAIVIFSKVIESSSRGNEGKSKHFPSM